MAQQTATFGRRNAPTAQRVLPAPAAARTTSPGRDIPLTYADPVTASAGVFGVEETDMMRYIGANWPKYRDLWQETKGGSELKVSFSLAAFFLTTFWMLYRKLYAMAFATIGAMIAINFVAPKYAWVVNLSICVAAGLYGKALVVQRGIKTVDRIKDMGLSGEAQARRIEKAGGTNWAAPISVLVVLFLIGAVAGAGAALQKAAEKSQQSKQTGPSVMRKVKV